MSANDWEPIEGQPVVEVRRPDGRAPVLLVCEHASNRFPPEFGTLGISADLAQSHIAWDPGALAVADGVSALLDAPLVASTVSRLIYDCNRPPDAPGAIAAKSEVFEVPGNRHLSPGARAHRTRAVYLPFRQAVSARINAGLRPVALMTIHSFTPVYMGRARPTEIGILHDSDSRLADAMLATAARHTTLKAERNAPYGREDGVTHTLIEHGVKAGLPNVMLEIRSDLIATCAQQTAMAAMLVHWLIEALGALNIDVDAPAGDRLGEKRCRNSL